MLTVDVALSFFGIAVLLALSPGPDNLFVLMQSAMLGKNAGLAVVLGLCTGLIGHTVAVAVGLAAVFAASETAFLVLKLAGAAYLLYLAWGAFRAPVSTAPETRPPALSHWALYRRGIIMNLTNPKVSLFFLAFLPQFTSPMRGSVALQTISLGALFMLAAFLVFSAIALFSGFFSAHLQKSAFTQRLINRLSALVFAGLALRLLLSER
ncbi:LysE family translocator [Neopusillimonas maritima]|jgi:threonine/homoserine/homoserine lactone efflux protein|uniref:Threonine transporter RhtB n=1 Tax=Neopusillimonas maritima TaxID=2026239 RepID=A0A3A1YW34_9BURK|nr:LysE family translocator [Neopusillimonas maritima]RIY41489.1 threonine transporter RhtB [Neopusillimonas maritima]